MGESSTARDLPLMPGSFDPGDYIDLYDDPIGVLSVVQESWRSKHRATPWSAHKLPSLDTEGIEWHTYEPPETLREAPDITSEILLEIVDSSIENVKARAAEESQRLREEEEQQKAAAEEEARQALERGEPYLPIIIKPEEPESTPDIEIRAEAVESPSDLSLRRAEAIQAISRPKSPGLIVFPIKPDKSSKLNLRRLFQRNAEKTKAASKGLRKMGVSHEKLHQSFLTASENLTPGQTSSADTAAAAPGTAANQPDPEEIVECVSCLDEFPRSNTVKVPCHHYCYDCFAALISNAVQTEQQWPPKCCLNEIPFRTILRYVPSDLKKTFRDRSSEWNVPVSERVYCHRADCSLWIKPKKVDRSRNEGSCDRGHKTCTLCRGALHPKQDCPLDRDMNLTNQLAEEEGWRRCQSCRALVEHKEACQHMTCRCGFQFCYVCGQRWRTCKCTMEMLAGIKSAAQTRREERQVKEQIEAEELRQMLAQIEEFERAEALKAAIHEEEQRRQEEERQQRELEQRQRELEERVRQESIRRREVELKYTVLRSNLDALHEVQRVTLETKLEEDAKVFAEEVEAAKEQLEKKQAEERAELDADAEAKMIEKDAAFNEDFTARSAAEKKIMDEYHNQLQLFWRWKPGGPREIERAMAPLRKRMEDGYSAWQAWKDQELERYMERLQERKAIKEEYMYSAKARLEDVSEGKEVELVKKGVAGQKWLQMVILERERLLGEMEAQEMEGDADSLFAADQENAEGASGEEEEEEGEAIGLAV